MTVPMDRRHFVQLGLATAGAGLLPASPTAAGRANPFAGTQVVWYDLAVPRARQIATSLQGGTHALGLHADPSTVLDQVLLLRGQGGPAVTITAVTREAAPFCLQQMLSHRDDHLVMRRVDHDLFLWTLQPARA